AAKLFCASAYSPASYWRMPAESACSPLVGIAPQEETSNATTAIRVFFMALFEAMSNGDLLARAHDHALDVRREIRVADLDRMVARGQLEHFQGRAHAAALAIHQDLSPGK